MTIILQHQFWDLKVGDDGFEVGLSFGGIPEKLTVPFEAINGFFDPSVQFGLQFEEVARGRRAPGAGECAGAADDREEALPAGPPAATSLAETAPPARPVHLPPARKPEKPEPDKPASGGGEVVRLDRFRKK